MSSHVSAVREYLIGDRLNAHVKTVSELVSASKIFVEDGNHGENRPRQDEFCERGNGTPFLRPPDLKEGRVDFKNCDFINEQGFARVRKGIGRPGDVILTHRATVGRIAITDDDAPHVFVTNPGTTIWRSLDSNLLDQRYMYYYMSSKIFQDRLFSEVGHTCTFDYVSLSQQRTLPVVIPEIDLQRQIAHILGTLDDKIELNRKTNETLEAMAKALFKSWFVDFDPVRAKVEGRPTGLPAEISDLFPDSFEDSELGEIPSGWRDGEIQDVAELNPEAWGSRNQPHSIRYLDLSNVKHGKIDSIEEYQWEDAPSRARRILKAGDTVVGTVRPGNGSYCLIGEDGITGSTGFAVLRPKSKIDSAFVYLCSCSSDNIDRLAHLADGGAYPAVRPELVAQTPVIIATRDVLDYFSRSVSPLFAAAEERRQSSKILCQVRDALLPKLISGELRIPDAEKLLEEVDV